MTSDEHRHHSHLDPVSHHDPLRDDVQGWTVVNMKRDWKKVFAFDR
jgi:hypothetical protein